MDLCHRLGCLSWNHLLNIKPFATTILVAILQRLQFLTQYFLKWYDQVQLYFLEILASFERYGHHYSTGSLSYRHQAHEKLASRRNLSPSRLQRMPRFSQIRLSQSTPNHTQVMRSKYRHCLLPTDGEIRPRSCLSENASAILGCHNLEIRRPITNG